MPPDEYIMLPNAIETSQKRQYEKLIREVMKLTPSRDPLDVYRVLSDRSGTFHSRELEKILLSKTARHHIARVMSSDSRRLAKLEKSTSKK